MTAHSHQTEADRNFEVYRRELPNLLSTSPGKFVVLHNSKIVDVFDTFSDAVKFGHEKFGPTKYSVQEITDVPVSLGYHSYALHPAKT